LKQPRLGQTLGAIGNCRESDPTQEPELMEKMAGLARLGKKETLSRFSHFSHSFGCCWPD